MTLKVGMLHQVLENFEICSNADSGLTLTYLMERSSLVPFLYVKNVKQRIFQKLL